MNIPEHLARKHGLGSNLDVTHADDFVADEDAVDAINEALEIAAQQTEGVRESFRTGGVANQRDAVIWTCVEIAARIRALKHEKPRFRGA